MTHSINAQQQAREYILKMAAQHAVMDLKPDVYEAVQDAVVSIRWDTNA